MNATNCIIPVSTEFADGVLITQSWCFTLVFILVTAAVKWRAQRSNSPNASTFSWQVNALLLGYLAAILTGFRWTTGCKSWLQVLDWMVWRLFGTSTRFYLVMFWITCLVASVAFCNCSRCIDHFREGLWQTKALTSPPPSPPLINGDAATATATDSSVAEALEWRATSVHRKFFHLIVSLVAVSGLIFEPRLLYLCAHVALQIHIVVETLRSAGVGPWAKAIDRVMLHFIDEAQESTRLILTPIYLFVGVFMPVLFEGLYVGNGPVMLTQIHFAGVQTVGIGDSFAALIGSWLTTRRRRRRSSDVNEINNADDDMSGGGGTRWTRISSWANKRKTLEGSTAMFISQQVLTTLVYAIAQLASQDGWTTTSILSTNFYHHALGVSSLITTLVEAHLSAFDNIVLPAVAIAVYCVMT